MKKIMVISLCLTYLLFYFNAGTVAAVSNLIPPLTVIKDVQINTFEIVLSPSTNTYDNAYVYSPYVFYDQTDNKFKMFYSGSSTSYPNYGTSVAYAESNDGRIWTNRQEIFNWGRKYYNYGSLVALKTDTGYAGFLNGYYVWRLSNWAWYIARSTSTDLTTWSSPATNFTGTNNGADFDGWMVYSPSVIYKNNQYEMWYGGLQNVGFPSGSVGRAVSTDGITWTNRTQVIPIPPGYTLGSASVILKSDNTYIMFLPETNTATNETIVKQKTSVDGINWVDDKVLFKGSDIAPYQLGGGRISWMKDFNTSKEYIYFTVNQAGTSHIARMEYGSASNIQITKTSDKTTAQYGDVITYTITATNIAGALLSNVRLVDDIPPGSTYESNSMELSVNNGSFTLLTDISDGVDSADFNISNPNGVFVSLGNLNAGDSATLQFKVKVQF